MYKLIILILMFVFFSYAEEIPYGYYARLSWVGGIHDLQLILRHPSEIEGKDCCFEQETVDWGVLEQSFDDPHWSSGSIGPTNYQIIYADSLNDLGIYKFIVRARSGGETEYTFEILRWNNRNDTFHKVGIVSSGSGSAEHQHTVIFPRDSKFYDLKTRILSFQQNKNGKFKIYGNYGYDINPDVFTNSVNGVIVYLNSTRAFFDDSPWSWNKKKTKFWINKPWTARLFMKNKSEFYIRGTTDVSFREKNVSCNVIFENYIGTNSFYVKKNRRYKFDEKNYLYPYKK